MIEFNKALTLALLPLPWAIVLGGVLGAVIGSYLATIFVRWPQGQSANQGRSRCDGCGRTLRGLEIVPIVSWLAVGGRCRSCRQPIAAAHTAIEILCATAGALSFACDQPLLAPLVWLLVVLAFFDAAYLWLPNVLVLPLALFCLMAPAPHEDVTVPLRLAGGVIGFAALWLIAAAFRIRTGRVGLGGGDAKLFGAIGLWSGALELPLVLLLACAIGFGDVLRRILQGDDDEQMRLPLGTYLAISTIFLAAMYQWISLQPNAGLLVLLVRYQAAGA